MKQLWIALALLLLTFLAVEANACCLSRFTLSLQEELSTGLTAASAGDWSGAAQSSAQFRRRWEQAQHYLHITLQHQDLDNIRLLLEELESCAQYRLSSGFDAASQKLSAALETLREEETVQLHNIF